MFRCSNAGKLEICGNSFSVRLDILYSFPRRGNWQGLKKKITGRKFTFFIATSPAIKLKAFYLNHVCYLLGVGDHFLQSFSQLEFLLLGFHIFNSPFEFEELF